MAVVDKLGGNWIIVRSHTTVAPDEIGGASELLETGLYGDELLLLAAWALAFAATDIATVWAALSPHRPMLPSGAALTLSIAFGFLVCWGLGGTGVNWLYVPTIMFLQTAMLLASLLVVRSSGYRIVRHRKTAHAQSDADPAQEAVT